MQVIFFIQIELLPVLYLSADIYLYLIRVVGYDEIYKVLCAWLKLELALEKIAHTLHHHLDERLSVVNALRHYDGRIARIAVLMCRDGLARALHIACSHSSLKVHGGCWHGVVDIHRGGGGHVALEILTLYQTYLQLTHDMLEGESDWGDRSHDVLACCKKQVARLITAESGGCLGCALVGADAEGLVGDAAYPFDVRIVSVSIEQTFVPKQGAAGSPFVAVKGESLVVNQIAAQLQRGIYISYIQTYSVITLKGCSCGTGLTRMSHHERHRRRLGVLTRSRFMLLTASHHS